MKYMAYHCSGEINCRVSDVQNVLDRVIKEFSNYQPCNRLCGWYLGGIYSRSFKLHEKGTYHRNYRSGWIVLGGITSGKGLRGSWYQTSSFVVQYSAG